MLPASRTSVLRAVFLQKWLRVHMERDPIVLFSCTLGLFGKHLRAACSRSRARLSRPALLRQPWCISGPSHSLLTALTCPLHACLSEGFTVPWIIGDGGRKREEMGTSYAYRIKSVYPNGS